MHYYKFNISDWHLATSHLNIEEEAIYFKLINFYYDSEQPISKEISAVCRRLRLSEYSGTVESILHEFFIKQDDGWHHLRCDDEIAKYHAKAEVNKAVGKLGGRPKKTIMVSENNPKQTLTTNQEPITKNHKPNIKAPEGVSSDVWNDFVLQRKKARAVITENVIKTIAKEAEKANWTLEQALAECAARGWRGFKADWVMQAEKKAKELPLATHEQIERAYREECGKDPKLARFNSYYEMKDFIIKHREKGTQRV